MTIKKVSEISGCEGCPLRAKFPNNTFVEPQVGSSLRLMVGEAPGEDESVLGRPFVGGSGRMMDSLLRKAGVKRDELTITNTICCRPPDNVYPSDNAARTYISEEDGRKAVRQCEANHLRPLIESRPWNRIDAIGEKALRVLTGKTDGILKWRGSPLPLTVLHSGSYEHAKATTGVALPHSGNEQQLDSSLRGPLVVPTLHPSFLMRTQYLIPAVISDLKKGTQTPPEFYNLEPTIEEVEGFVDSDCLTFDIETNRFTNQITMVGVSVRPYHVTVVPYRGAYIASLRRVIASAKALVGQNIIGFDIPFLKNNGFTLREDVQLWDIMLMQHLLQPDMDHDLEFISSIFTQKPAWKHLNTENMALYCARDVDVTLQAYLQLKPNLKQQSLENLYKYVQVPLGMICKAMHDTGIKTDPARLKKIRTQLLGELAELELKLPEELRPYDKPVKKRVKAPAGTLGKSGRPVKFTHVDATQRITPYNSPKLIEKYLYETLALPKQLHPKTKRLSTDKSALERLYRKLSKGDKDGDLAKAEIITSLRKVSSLDTLISSFLKDDSGTSSPGRVHANFLVHGTSTGRLSSSNPNMQNVPPKSRYIYVPPYPDWCFIECDFESLENRLAAWYAGDTERLARLNTPGFNEHKWLTSQIYGMSESEITKDMWQYKRGKNTNHGADGAMGPRKLAMTYDIPESEAKDLLFKWRSINRASADWQERAGNAASRDGILTNAFGRKRWFWSQSSYTEGIRFLPQSTGADICFRAMIALYYKRIGWSEENVLKVSSVLAPLPEPAQLVLQVHDSLLIATPANLLKDCARQMKAACTQLWTQLGGTGIPVAFKAGRPGDSWGELVSYNVD